MVPFLPPFAPDPRQDELRQRLLASTVLGQAHPALGTWGLLDPKLAGTTARVAEKVGGWTLGRLGLQKALGGFAGPVGGLVIGSLLGAFGRLFGRRRRPTGDIRLAYESFQREGQKNIYQGLMDQLSAMRKQEVDRILAAAQNVGNRQWGSAVAHSIAPQAMEAAQRMYATGLQTAAEHDIRMRTLGTDMRKFYDQLGLEREMNEKRMALERQQRQLAILTSVIPVIFNQGRGSA